MYTVFKQKLSVKLSKAKNRFLFCIISVLGLYILLTFSTFYGNRDIIWASHDCNLASAYFDFHENLGPSFLTDNQRLLCEMKHHSLS